MGENGAPRRAKLTESSGSNELLTKKAVRGSVWLFSSYALNRLGHIVMMLVIATLLSPREYGIIGLSTVIITVGQIINESGIWQSVVYRRDPDERFLNTAFAANCLIGLFTATGIFMVAPWLAGFFREPEMTAVLQIMGLSLILDAIFYVPDGMLRKEFRFKSRVLPEVAGAVVFATTTIALVIFGLGVLSYAIGFVTQSVVRCALTMRQIRWRPGLLFSWTMLKEIVSYAKDILGGNLARHISSNMDYFVVGRVLGAGPLGLYTLAFNLANYPVSNFAQILSRVAFPTFAALRENPDYAKRVYLKMIRLLAVLVTPTITLLALLAGAVILEVFGEKWEPAVFPLQVMVVAGISRVVSYPSSDMMRAFGSPDVPFKINILEGLTLSVVLVLVASRGIDAVAVAVSVVLSTSAWASTIIACRKYGVELRKLALALLPGLVLAASGAAAVLLLQLLDLSFMPGALRLVLLVGAAGTAIMTCLATVYRNILREVVMLLASGKSQ